MTRADHRTTQVGRREAHAVGRVTPEGVLHAVEMIRGSVRPMCQKEWRRTDAPGVETFDYRYRESGHCHHAACETAFREQLRD